MLEAPNRFELMVGQLQCRALPLGYRAILTAIYIIANPLFIVKSISAFYYFLALSY